MGFRGSRIDSGRPAPATSHPNPRGRDEVDGVRVGVTTCYFGGFSHSQVLPEDALTSRDTTFGSTCCCAARAPHSGALPGCATSRSFSSRIQHAALPSSNLACSYELTATSAVAKWSDGEVALSHPASSYQSVTSFTTMLIAVRELT